jgi:ubiquinone/menaquinone biosynthesis C-methylase UbiE
MDATELALADSTFDTVVCIEAAFHFPTRERFLQESFRVLKPGGYLAMSDLLMAWGTGLVPLENHLATPRAYRDLLERCGFTDVVVVDATNETWRVYRQRFTQYLIERSAREMNLASVAGYLMYVNMICAWAIRACVLTAARRPIGESR